jgi:NitT/TauT family transport system ATP-binding protein
MAPRQEPIISLRGVSRVFRGQRGEVVALAEVDFDVFEGELVTVVGPSGCGKSTLLNIIVGLLEPSAGEKDFEGRPSAGINPAIGYVTQSDNLFPWRTVFGNVVFGLEMRGIGARAQRRERAMALIDKVGLTGFEHHYRHELSGGMRQRVNIIRTLAYDPKVILLDEPFGPLDAQTRLQLQDLLLDLWRERAGSTLIFITHDLTEAIALGDRVVVMSARPGRVREVVPVDLARPRDIFTISTEPEFRALYDRVWAHLADEMRQRVD